jgi:hypothetical protein
MTDTDLHVLCIIKAEAIKISECSALVNMIFRFNGMGEVFYGLEVVTFGDVADSIHIRYSSYEINRKIGVCI